MRQSKFLPCVAMFLFVFSLALPEAVMARGRSSKSVKSSSAAEADTSAASTETADTKTNSSKRSEKKPEEKSDAVSNDFNRKSPRLAAGLAIFPGIALHGVGHMYAGSWVKGLGLLAIEGASVAVIAVNATRLIDEADNFSNGKIPTDFNNAFTVVGVSVVALTAFLYTWFDDMGGAPIAAMAYNKRMEERSSQAKLKLMPTSDFAGLGIGLSKRF